MGVAIHIVIEDVFPPIAPGRYYGRAHRQIAAEEDAPYLIRVLHRGEEHHYTRLDPILFPSYSVHVLCLEGWRTAKN